MDDSLKTGFMAVFAVSGSVVFLAMQAHKRLLSNFMKKMEFEIKKSNTGTDKVEPKKKVRFAIDSTADEKDGKKKHSFSNRNIIIDENFEAMPENWQAMYKGILKYKNIRCYN